MLVSGDVCDKKGRKRIFSDLCDILFGSKSLYVLLVKNAYAVCSKGDCGLCCVSGLENHIGVFGICAAREGVHIINVIAAAAERGEDAAQSAGSIGGGCRPVIPIYAPRPRAKAFLFSSRNLGGTTASSALSHALSGRSK